MATQPWVEEKARGVQQRKRGRMKQSRKHRNWPCSEGRRPRRSPDWKRSTLQNNRLNRGNMTLSEAISPLHSKQKRSSRRREVNTMRVYKNTFKKLTSKTPFQLVYGIEVVMIMEYIVPRLCIASFIGMAYCGALEEWIAQLTELQQDRFLAGFHQHVQKEHEKAWHDRHIKLCTFKVNDLVLLYDSKFDQFPGKFQMHCLGPYVMKEITDRGMIQLSKLNEEPFLGRVNGSQLKLYVGYLAQQIHGGRTILVLQATLRERGTINYIAQFWGLHDMGAA